VIKVFELNGKTVLITGATGLIGGHIVDGFMSMKNIYVVALSRSKFKLKKRFASYIGNKYFKYVARNVCEPFDLASIGFAENNYSVDIIFHAASPISRKTIDELPVDVIKPNLFATQNLLDGLINQQYKTRINGRIIIFSSVAVYGGKFETDVKVIEDDTMYAERLESSNAPYAESKRMAEVMTQAYIKQYGVDAVITRPSYVYGSTMFPPETAVYEFINNVLSGKDIHLKNSGTSKRDNIYIDDVISALFTILIKGKTGHAYNISSGGELSNFAAIDELAEIVVHIANEKFARNIKILHETEKTLSRKPGVISDNTKLKSLGWTLRTSIADGLRDTISKQAAIISS
jgi:nucleoside-diphosphate-sugar epimerase